MPIAFLRASVRTLQAKDGKARVPSARTKTGRLTCGVVVKLSGKLTRITYRRPETGSGTARIRVMCLHSASVLAIAGCANNGASSKANNKNTRIIRIPSDAVRVL